MVIQLLLIYKMYKVIRHPCWGLSRRKSGCVTAIVGTVYTGWNEGKQDI